MPFPLERGGYSLSVKRIEDLIKFGDHREVEPIYEVLANQIIDGNLEKERFSFKLENS